MAESTNLAHESFSESEDVNEEIEALRAIYSGDSEFSVKKHEGLDNDNTSSYMCDIIINPQDMMIGLCFSLPASYPETTPRIEITPRQEMSDENISKLLVYLYQVAQENAGGAAIYSLVESAKHWIQENQIEEKEAQVEKDGNASTQSSQDEVPMKGEKQKKKTPSDEKSGKNQKKPPMKTATDVIHRIQWDEQVNADHFIVGYLDRFVGIVEQPFTSFYWEDISGVDQHTLAIPRHRIQYFKYKDEIVWDKTRRLDNVFGSQGSGVTITDVIEQFSKENAAEGGSSEKELDDTEDSDIEFGNDYGQSESVASRRRVNKSRPNYFLAIRITDDEVKSYVKRIHDDMTEYDPSLTPYLISPAHLHITLCMLQLNSPSQVSSALSVLKSIQSELVSLLLPVTILRFEGLDTFHDRIVYLKPQANPALNQLAKCLQNSLLKAGISLIGTREEFVPHLTIMKMTREETSSHPTLTSKLKTKYSDAIFGCQVVDAIHLCSLETKPAQDDFYYSLAKIDVVE